MFLLVVIVFTFLILLKIYSYLLNEYYFLNFLVDSMDFFYQIPNVEVITCFSGWLLVDKEQ